MTPKHDRAVVDRLYATPLESPPSYTRAEVRALPRDWARSNPPRRFALYRTVEDEAGCDGDVFAWGLAYDHYVIVRSNDELLHGRFVSTASMFDYLSRTPAEVDIVWIDTERGPQGCA